MAKANPNPPQVDCSKDKIRTKQSFARECDINNIMKKVQRTGVIPDAMYRAGSFGDFTGVDDFQDAQLKLKTANDAFMRLPSAVRNKFSNDPAGLIAFMADPNNRQEAIELGLIPKDPEPDKMPPAAPTAPPDPVPPTPTD